MDREKKKILIVEDEQALSKVLSLKLSSAGYDVMVIGDGDLFEKVFEREKPNVVLLDLMIPGLDGFSILKDLKENKKMSVPFIILSNLNQDEDKNKTKDLGVIDYFVKSDTPINEIIKKVNSILK